jgi:methylthioribose-1-phosphate isomerase
MIDQRVLPGRLEVVAFSDYQSVAQAIQAMVVRGAPAIGVAAAYGLVLAGLQSSAADRDTFIDDLRQASQALGAARPTAVNLQWALQKVLEAVTSWNENPSTLRQKLLALAHAMAEEDIAVNRAMAQYGASLIEDGDTIIHHCNTGALATVDWGTALGAIRYAHEQGKRLHVFVDETRPRLQGSRLTAWELQHLGIPFDIITDNMAGHFLHTGQANKVFFGADRVAANGDVANKIGSYMLALAARDNHVPVYSVFPTSTVDLSINDGNHIPIEERDPSEVLEIQLKGEQVTPTGATARNPAFDVTPHRLITALVTEKGVVYPPFKLNLPAIIQSVPQAKEG